MRRVLLTVGVVALLAPAPTAVAGPAVTATRYGALDFGDRIAFHADARRCARVRAKLRVVLASGAVAGRVARARPDGAEGGCTGAAAVPSFGAVRAAGWHPGDAIALELASTGGTTPLRFARIEVDRATPVAGAPRVVPAGDQDTGSGDRALAMEQGDVVALGRADLRRIEAIALRVCIAGTDNPVLPGGANLVIPERVEPPVTMSLREDAPNGPALVGPIDVASDPFTEGRLATFGFGGCYRLVSLPLTRTPTDDAPELFLRVDGAPPGVLKVNTMDLAGTGAKSAAARTPDPPGMRTIFDGRSFAGFTQTHCRLSDGAVVNATKTSDVDISGCAMTFAKPVHDIVLRLRLRRQSFFDNAGLYLGDQEIQLRSAGEFLPGGYFGQFAARWQKLNSFPQWSTVEVVQLGARHVVTINGRTVTDVLRAGGSPAPYHLRLVNQPEWSYRVGAQMGFGEEPGPAIVRPSEWGAFAWRDVRLLECRSATDPVCTAMADARRGQVPVPAGASAAGRRSAAGR